MEGPLALFFEVSPIMLNKGHGEPFLGVWHEVGFFGWPVADTLSARQGRHRINSAGGREPRLSASPCALCFSLSCRGSRWVPASWPPWSNTSEKGESSGGSKIRVLGFSVIRYPGSRAQAYINCCGPRIGLPGLGQMLILNCGVQGGGPSQPNHTDWERGGAGLQRKSG